MKYAFGVILLGLCVGCARQPWPEPPVIDQATYQKEYQKWLDAQQETARDGTKEVGIWPLQEGETAFGSDASLPIALPVRAVPDRAGVFRLATNRRSDLRERACDHRGALAVGDRQGVRAIRRPAHR